VIENNEDRADNGEDVVHFYAENAYFIHGGVDTDEDGDEMEAERECMVADLLADIGHYCRGG
jgi:hypothetical protein